MVFYWLMTAFETLFSFLRNFLRVDNKRSVKVPKIFRVNCGTKGWRFLAITLCTSRYRSIIWGCFQERRKLPISTHVSWSSRASCLACARKLTRFGRCRLWRLRSLRSFVQLATSFDDNMRHFCIAPVGYRTQTLRLHLLFLLLPVIFLLEQHSACFFRNFTCAFY